MSRWSHIERTAAGSWERVQSIEDLFEFSLQAVSAQQINGGATVIERRLAIDAAAPPKGAALWAADAASAAAGNDNWLASVGASKRGRRQTNNALQHL